MSFPSFLSFVSLLSLLLLPFFFILSILLPLLFPTIIHHPYPPSTRKENKTVMLAGSFNPPHLGHFKMLQYLSQRFTKVYAVVGFNPKKTYPVPPSDRLTLLKSLTSNLPNVTPILVSGLIWRWASQNKISIMFRGIRTWSEDGRDENYLHFQNLFFPWFLGPITVPIKTLFLEGSKDTRHISSTVVRKLCEGDKIAELEELVGKGSGEEVKRFYGKKGK
ncbi:hypothetical protein TL16_g09674 [Triparma laevis f. inornata]|uniref:Phosphopantetheine adenylyltransferase n=1 Tax=Triparma laevis f. inornata TaxID=1714386 RepID=A0A9W7EJY5_9STRA|nr:hypothetical protein TL16_g09674 [Triparma laevis f. inornata]